MTPTEREQIIRKVCLAVGFPEPLAVAVAQVESAMGRYQKSPTGARGVFQLTSIAFKDMMESLTSTERHERTDILCGVAFLCLLQDRWEGIEAIVSHFCDPAEKEAYWKKVQYLLESPIAGTNQRVNVNA